MKLTLLVSALAGFGAFWLAGELGFRSPQAVSIGISIAAIAISLVTIIRSPR